MKRTGPVFVMNSYNFILSLSVVWLIFTIAFHGSFLFSVFLVLCLSCGYFSIGKESFSESAFKDFKKLRKKFDRVKEGEKKYGQKKF